MTNSSNLVVQLREGVRLNCGELTLTLPSGVAGPRQAICTIAPGLILQAADEIERLQKLVQSYDHLLYGNAEGVHAENERLRAYERIVKRIDGALGDGWAVRLATNLTEQPNETT